MSNSLLHLLKSEGYRWGDCQVLRYDPKLPEVFPEGFVTHLYQLCRGDGHRHSNILPTLFCGMSNLDHDSITTYLATRPLIIPVIWDSPQSFTITGLAFPVLFQPTLNIPVEGDQRMAFAGYGFFREFWGDPRLPTLGMLGLAYLFREFSLSAIHGIRYAENALTARFMSQFGSRQTGNVPRYQLRNKVLVPGVVSSLTREDFEAYVERRLLQLNENEASEAGDASNGKRWG